MQVQVAGHLEMFPVSRARRTASASCSSVNVLRFLLGISDILAYFTRFGVSEISWEGQTFSIFLEDGGASASAIVGLQLIDNYFGTYPTVGLFHNHNQVPVSQYAHERNLYFPSQLSADPNLVD